MSEQTTPKVTTAETAIVEQCEAARSIGSTMNIALTRPDLIDVAVEEAEKQIAEGLKATMARVTELQNAINAKATALRTGVDAAIRATLPAELSQLSMDMQALLAASGPLTVDRAHQISMPCGWWTCCAGESKPITAVCYTASVVIRSKDSAPGGIYPINVQLHAARQTYTLADEFITTIRELMQLNVDLAATQVTAGEWRGRQNNLPAYRRSLKNRLTRSELARTAGGAQLLDTILEGVTGEVADMHKLAIAPEEPRESRRRR